MKIAAHLKLARSWTTTLAKLDPETDHLAILEFSMMLGTTLMNAVLHKRGITDESFDQHHTNRPPFSEEMMTKVTPDISKMMEMMAFLENARNLHCRAIGHDRTAPRVLPKWEPNVVSQCAIRLRAIQAFADVVMQEKSNCA